MHTGLEHMTDQELMVEIRESGEYFRFFLRRKEIRHHDSEYQHARKRFFNCLDEVTRRTDERMTASPSRSTHRH